MLSQQRDQMDHPGHQEKENQDLKKDHLDLHQRANLASWVNSSLVALVSHTQNLIAKRFMNSLMNCMMIIVVVVASI